MINEQYEEAIRIALLGISKLKWELTRKSDNQERVDAHDMQCKLIELEGHISNMAFLNVTPDGKWLGKKGEEV